MAQAEAPTVEGQRRGRKEGQRIEPYTGKESLKRPDFYDAKGLPRTGKPDGASVQFVPEKKYAIENGTLVAYHYGRGGIRKRGMASLVVSARDKRTKSEKFQRVAALREKLKKAGIPGA